MKEFLIPCRVTFEGTALVKACNNEGALVKFDLGDFEFLDFSLASRTDWEPRGDPELNE